MPYRVEILYERLKDDLRIPLDDLPVIFEKLLGEKISPYTARAWFIRKSLPPERLAQLLTIVWLNDGRRLDLWNYFEVRGPANRKVA